MHPGWYPRAKGGIDRFYSPARHPENNLRTSNSAVALGVTDASDPGYGLPSLFRSTRRVKLLILMGYREAIV